MKTKSTLGTSIKEARETLGMTQRKLAGLVGVKASHIAYIESNQRRPSLPLLRKLAQVLGLDRREMLFLSYPDAKLLVGDINGAEDKPDPWKEFTANRALLRRHQITSGELKVLKQVSMLQQVSSPKHFLFILNAIRQAAA